MPDIAMCANGACPSRAECYRHPASGTRPSLWQTFAGFAPDVGADRCDHFWPIKPLDRRPKKR